jgi:ubiquinone/menaquinone biosynthesis C-methylase UbiE
MPDGTETEAHRVAAVYDEVAREYDEWTWQRFWRKNEQPLVAELLNRRRSKFTLDVGVGTGAYVPIHRAASDVTIGVDISAGMLTVLREEWPDFPVAVASATHLPFGEAVFDTLLATRVLTHLEDLEAFFAQARRVSNENGRIVISDLDSEHRYEEIRFSEVPGSTPALSLRPFKRSTEDLSLAANKQGFVVSEVIRVTRGELLWEPGLSAPATLGRDPNGPVFFAMQFDRMR